MSKLAERYDGLCFRAKALSMLLIQLEEDVKEHGDDWEMLLLGHNIHILHEGASVFRTGVLTAPVVPDKAKAEQ